jgi:predicted nucleic acid-binding protein
VSLADCVAAAAALERHDAVATCDPHLLDLCHAEGIATVVLAASDGSRWAPPD